MTAPLSSSSQRPLRSDARKHREALLSAAAACFAESGYGVALEVIAERAGVGRGTLYRNFKDREALALALFAREVDRLEAMIDPKRPITDTLVRLVHNGASTSALFARIAAELRQEDANLTSFRELGARLETALAPAVAQAQARGELAGHIGTRHLVIAVRMMNGLLLPAMSEAELAEQLSGALALLTEGLRPRPPAPSSQGPAPR
jgi:AcrR family transcriptional regulator